MPHLRARVIQVLPHDTSAFTEGLEIADGSLYESTGEYGSSMLKVEDPATLAVRQQVRLPDEFFGEGVTVVGDRIWQLTYREGVAIQRDRASLRETGRARYSDGEGWGLCHQDDNQLISSNGTPQLTFRDPATFAGQRRITAHRPGGQPIAGINELECGGGQIWANLYGSDQIVRLDPSTGQLTAVVDARGLLPPEQREHLDVLNGIAAIPGTDQFLLTGKDWPNAFRVEFR